MSDCAGPLAYRRMGHLPALDGLRGIAILLVVAVHLYAPVFSGGGSGVDLFFVLSGFLITKLAYEEHQAHGAFSRQDFYLRRVFRILPALFFLLACMLTASVTVLRDVGHTLRMETLFSALSIGNLWPLFFGFTPRTALGHTWSLGFEEQFYLIWPLVLAVAPIAFVSPRRFFRWVTGVTLLSVLVGRVVLIGLLHYPHWGSIPFLDFDGIALGCLIAIFVHTDLRGTAARLPIWLPAAAAAVVSLDLFAARLYTGHDTYNLRVLVLRAAFGCIIIVLVSTPHGRLATLFGNDRIGYIGRISYSLYLWHLPIFYMLSSERAGALSRPLRLPLELALAGLAAALSHRYLERPALALGRRVRQAARIRRTKASPAPEASTELSGPA